VKAAIVFQVENPCYDTNDIPTPKKYRMRNLDMEGNST